MRDAGKPTFPDLLEVRAGVTVVGGERARWLLAWRVPRRVDILWSMEEGDLYDPNIALRRIFTIRMVYGCRKAGCWDFRATTITKPKQPQPQVSRRRWIFKVEDPVDSPCSYSSRNVIGFSCAVSWWELWRFAQSIVRSSRRGTVHDEGSGAESEMPYIAGDWESVLAGGWILGWRQQWVGCVLFAEHFALLVDEFGVFSKIGRAHV